jgi:hypothetical protein
MSLWTDFRADLETLERQKRERALRVVNKQPINRARLWQVGVTAFLATLLFLWGILHPLAWRAFR